MEIKVIVSEEKRNEYGGNSEPYKGFFSNKELLYKKIDYGWDTLPRWGREFAGFCSYSRRSSLVRPTRQFEGEIYGSEMLEVWPRVVFERGFYVQTPEDLGLKIAHDEDGRSYSVQVNDVDDYDEEKLLTVNSINELLKLEKFGMPTKEAVEQVVKPYQKAGCKPWYGTMLTVVTGSSIQHVELGAETGNIEKILSLEKVVLDKAKEIYGALNEKKVEQFYGLDFNEQMRADLSVNEESENDPFDNPFQLLKLFELLPGAMLRNHTKAAKKAGFLAADKELYKSVKKYCKGHSLPVTYQDQGKSIQKWLLKEKLEGREHFVVTYGKMSMPGPSRKELQQLPLEELERITIDHRVDGLDWHKIVDKD